MSKIVEATLDADGNVKVGTLTIEDAIILSEGNGPSTGILILQNDKCYYHTSSATDIKDTLTQVVDALTAIASALTAIDGKATAGSGSVVTPVAAGNVSTINTAKAALNTLKGNLK